MNPWETFIKNIDGTIKCKKLYVLMVDGDKKICDGCDEYKSNVASIVSVSGNVSCICQNCILDIARVWDRPRKVILEKIKL